MDWFLLPEATLKRGGADQNSAPHFKGAAAHDRPVSPSNACKVANSVNAPKKPAKPRRPCSAQPQKPPRSAGGSLPLSGTVPSSASLTGSSTSQMRRRVLKASSSQTDLSRQMKRTQSGVLARRPGDDVPVREGGMHSAISGAAGSSALARKMRGTTSLGVLSPYNQQAFVLPLSGKRHGCGVTGGLMASAGRSGDNHTAAQQLEVKLSQGLQALLDAERGSASGGQSSKRRLQLFSTLFERIIEREPQFGLLLRRIKSEYEAALQLAQEHTSSEKLLQQTSELKLVASRLEEENIELRHELQRAIGHTQELQAQLRAYEQHMYEQQKRSHEEQEAEEALLAAELAAEMPASARPGSITPTLGSGRLAEAPRNPGRPACIPSLDMAAVEAVRQQEAAAEEAEGEEADDGRGDPASDYAHDSVPHAGSTDHRDLMGEYADSDGDERPGIDEYECDEHAQRNGPPVPNMGVPALDLSDLVHASYQEEFEAAEAAAALDAKFSGNPAAEYEPRVLED